MELDLFDTLAEICPFPVLLVRIKDDVILKANQKFYEQSGYLTENVIGRNVDELGGWPDPMQYSKVVNTIKKYGRLSSWPVKLRMSNGEIHDFSLSAQLVEFNGMQCSLCVSVEIGVKRPCEETLIEKDKKISEMEHQLQDFNTALSVLSGRYESEKNDQYKKLITNIEKSILPYLEKLKVGKIDSTSRTFLSIIESNLNGILGSITRFSAVRPEDFTIAENQVTDLIRQGKSSKEIAAMLNVSTAAISFHRNNIRKKLGLTNKKVSLNTHLANIMK